MNLAVANTVKTLAQEITVTRVEAVIGTTTIITTENMERNVIDDFRLVF